MRNYEKYFGTPELASNTLEDILFNKKDICDFCSLKDECEKNSEIIDDFDCCDGIKYFLLKTNDEE